MLWIYGICFALRSSDVDTKNKRVWYTWHTFRFTMRLLVRKGTSQRPLFVGKTQEYVDTEDFICAMMQHAKPCGSINNVFVDFENTQILVSHVAEVRVVAQLAAAYYNATLAQNLSCQKDLIVVASIALLIFFVASQIVEKEQRDGTTAPTVITTKAAVASVPANVMNPILLRMRMH